MPVNNTARIVHHAPTGHYLVVNRIDFRDGVIFAKYVYGYQGTKITLVRNVAVKCSDCTRPEEVRLTMEWMNRLLDSGRAHHATLVVQ